MSFLLHLHLLLHLDSSEGFLGKWVSGWICTSANRAESELTTVPIFTEVLSNLALTYLSCPLSVRVVLTERLHARVSHGCIPCHILTRFADIGSGFYNSDLMAVLGVTPAAHILGHSSGYSSALLPSLPPWVLTLTGYWTHRHSGW